MNRIIIYEKWMDFKAHFKKNPLVFQVVRWIKYRILRKIEIQMKIIAWSILHFLKEKKILPYNDNDMKLMGLKNRHFGETAFIIGNGPSLRSEDLDRLQKINAFTFASNRITLMFDKTTWRPDCYLAVDRTLCNGNDQTLQKVINTDIGLYAFSKPLYERIPSTQKMNSMVYCHVLPTDFYSEKELFGIDPTLYFGNGFTVTYFAIQLAVYMGFKRICLMGVDCNYANVQTRDGKIHSDGSIVTYFDKEYDKANKNSAYIDGMLAAYRAAQEYAVNNGIEILNLSETSKVGIFKMVPLHQVLSEL